MNPDGHYIVEDGKTLGPLTLDQLKWMWKLGTVNAETPYWREGLSVWISLGSSVEAAIKEDEWQTTQAAASATNSPIKPDAPSDRISPRLALTIFSLAMLLIVGWSAWTLSSGVFHPKSKPAAPAPVLSVDSASYARGEQAGAQFARDNFQQGARFAKEPAALALIAKTRSQGNPDFARGFERGYSAEWPRLVAR